MEEALQLLHSPSSGWTEPGFEESEELIAAHYFLVALSIVNKNQTLTFIGAEFCLLSSASG